MDHPSTTCKTMRVIAVLENITQILDRMLPVAMGWLIPPASPSTNLIAQTLNSHRI